MQYGNVTGIDKPVSRIVQGCVMMKTDEQEKWNELLDACLATGVNCFDTAHGYGDGESERTLGAWIEARGNRDQIVLLDKGAHHSDDRKRVTPYDIGADVLDGLVRLRTDHIDLFVLHRDDESVPVGPIVEALNEHKSAGRIGAFGGSNWTHRRIAEANEYADAHNLTPFAVTSPNYTLAVQKEEPWADCVSIAGPAGAEARAYYTKQQMPVFAWSALAGGFFSGRFTRENLDQFEEYFDALVVRCYCTEENFQRLDRVKQLAAERTLSVAQVAVAYVLSTSLNLFALTAARTPEEATANASSAAVQLTTEELAWLNLQTDSR